MRKLVEPSGVKYNAKCKDSDDGIYTLRRRGGPLESG